MRAKENLEITYNDALIPQLSKSKPKNINGVPNVQELVRGTAGLELFCTSSVPSPLYHRPPHPFQAGKKHLQSLLI